jgi:hypothetical protein
MDIEFTNAEKIDCFDKLAAHFYEKNFGELSKSDFELLMFHFYYKKLTDTYKTGDVIDYSKCTDYQISKALGVTQQRVRNLKVKSQLKYPLSFEWKTALAPLTKTAQYDKETKTIKLAIQDASLFLEVENFFNERNVPIEMPNSKLIQVPAAYYIDLIAELEPEQKRKAIIKEIKKVLKENGTSDNQFDEKHIGKSIIESSGNIAAVFSKVATVVSSANVLISALMPLIR